MSAGAAFGLALAVTLSSVGSVVAEGDERGRCVARRRPALGLLDGDLNPGTPTLSVEFII